MGTCPVPSTLLEVEMAARKQEKLQQWAQITESLPNPLNTARVISQTELAQHSVEGDYWIALNGNVYNITEFFACHPGGLPCLQGSQDLSVAFNQYHRTWVRRVVQMMILLTRLTSPSPYPFVA
jgi:cytochrome b involved in lipid metabolism